MTAPGHDLAASTESLVDHLHSRAEAERSDMARELHDHLGGLMVAAMMDLAWAQQHLTPAPDMQSRLTRASDALRSGIDLKRQLVERLQPSLLREVGLYSALSWLMRSMCGRAGVEYAEDLITPEPTLVNGTPIEIYRIAQEAIELFIGLRSENLLILTAKLEPGAFALGLSMDVDDPAKAIGTERSKPLFMSIAHRARRLHGTLALESAGEQLRLEFRLPQG